MFVQSGAVKKSHRSTQLCRANLEKSAQLAHQKLPVPLRKKLGTLERTLGKEALRQLILELCSACPFSAQELAVLLNKKSKKALVRDHLTPMRKAGLIAIENPKEQASNQKYIVETTFK